MTRRNYFIKKKFQADIFVRFGLLLLLEAILIAGLLLYVSSGTLTTGYQGAQLTIAKTSHFFLVRFLLVSMIVGLAMALAGMLVFLFLSHRLAGPLYRFEHSLEELARGNFTYRFRLRRADQLDSLAQALNRCNERLDERMGQVKRDVRELAKLVAAKDASNNLSQLREAVDHLQETADTFKTSS